MEQADIVLLLVSSDFLNSDYCYSTERTRTLQRRADGLCDVVPVILRPCIWQQSAELREPKAIPNDGKPVIKWTSHDEAFADIAQNIVALLAHRAASSQRATRHSGPVKTEVADVPNARPSVPMPVLPVKRSSNLALPRRFTDQDKHDFLQDTFTFVRTYFEASLHELQVRNAGAEGRLREVSARAFQAFVFRDGKQGAACYIRIGGSFGQNSIGYTHGERIDDNSYNDMLAVAADDEKLYLTATLSMSNQTDRKLSKDGAAEYLWERFIAPLQQRSW